MKEKMTGDVFLSYVVPCYNVAKYLPKCIESLREQDIPDHGIEFIMVNDGSPDNCLELLKDFAVKEPRAVVVDQKNQGVSAARNAGLSVAKGEYVFFLDGDDYLTDDASFILYEISEKHKSDIIVANAYKVIDGNWDDKTYWNTCSKISEGNYSVDEFVNEVGALPVSFKAYRRMFLIENGIQYDKDLAVGEVFTFFIHALQYSKSIYFTNKRIMNYVVRDSGVMRTFDLEKDRTILTTISRMDEYASGPLLNLRMYMSYNASFYRIVRIFTLNKYIRQTGYTTEVGLLLKTVRNTEPFRRALYFITFRKCPLQRKMYAICQLIFPVRMYYKFIRWQLKNLRNQDVK